MKKLLRIMVIVLVVIGAMFAINSNEVFGTNTRTLNIRMSRPYYNPNREYDLERGDLTYHIVKIFDVARAHAAQPTLPGGSLYPDAIYCLRAGQGFGTHGDNNPRPIHYTRRGDMFVNRTTVQPRFADVIGRNNNAAFNQDYNAVLWIINEMFLPRHPDREEMRIQLLTNARAHAVATNPGSFIMEVDSPTHRNTLNGLLTDDDIEVIQQIAMWQFTNSDQAGTNIIPDGPAGIDNSVVLPPGASIENALLIDRLHPTGERVQAIRILYNYLVAMARANMANAPTPIERPTVRIEETSPRIEVDGNFYVVGPFRIVGDGDLDRANLKITHEEVRYTLDGSSWPIDIGVFGGATVIQNGVEVPDITSLGQMINEGNFYLRFSTQWREGITAVSMELEYEYLFWEVTSACYYDATNNTYEEQPVVIVNKTRREGSGDTDIITVSGRFNLLIVKIDEEGNRIENNPAEFHIRRLPNYVGGYHTTDANGNILLSDIEITYAGEVFIFEIRETRAPEGYQIIVEPFHVRITTAREENEFVVVNVELGRMVAGNFVPGGVTGVRIDRNGNIVGVGVENRRIEGNFGLELRKIDEDGVLITSDDATFEVVRTTATGVPVETIGVFSTADGVVRVITGMEIEYSGQEFTFRITEIEAPEGFEILTEIFYVRVRTGLVEGALVVTNIDLGRRVEGVLVFDNNVEGVERSQEESLVVIHITNVRIDGSFNLRLRKVDEHGYLITRDFARFQVEKVEEDGTLIENLGIFSTTTTGIINITGIEITMPEQVFIFRITEVEAPEGYEILTESFYVRVTTDLVDGQFVVESIDIGRLEDGTIVFDNDVEGVTYDQEGNLVIVHIVNRELDGEFNLRLRKVDEQGYLITRDFARFQVEKVEEDGTLIENLGIFSTTTTGIINITGIEITMPEQVFIFRITEVEAPEGYEILTESFYVRVTTDLVDGQFVVESIDIGRLEDGTIVFDNDVEGVTYDQEGNLVIVHIVNRELEGEFGLRLRKVNEQGGLITSSNARFQVEKVEEDGTLIENLGTFTTANGIVTVITGVVIEEEDQVFIFRIAEVEAPEGYEMLAESFYVRVTTEDFEISSIDIGRLEDGSLVFDNDVEGVTGSQQGNLVVIDVVNRRTEGEFDLRIRKANEEGALITRDDAAFQIERVEEDGTVIENLGVHRTTNNGVVTGIIDITGIDIEYDGEEFIFRVTEVEAPEGHEILAESFYVRVSTEGFEVIAIEIGQRVDDELVFDDDVEGVTGSRVGNLVTINVVNRLTEGEFDLRIRKVNEEGALITRYNAAFEIRRVEEDGTVIENLGVHRTTNNGIITGIIEITGIEIEYDGEEFIFRITEVEAPEGYEILSESFYVRVSTEGFEVTAIEIGQRVDDELVFDDDVEGVTGSRTGNIVTVNVVNRRLQGEGEFDLRIKKTDYDTGQLITRDSATFAVARVALDGTVLEHLGSFTTTRDGVITGIIEITGIEITYEDEEFIFRIIEIEAPEGYTILSESFYVRVRTEQRGTDFVVASIDTGRVTGGNFVVNNNMPGIDATRANNVITIEVANRILYFDLGLYKWVSETRVTSAGNTRTRTHQMPSDEPWSSYLVRIPLERNETRNAIVDVVYTIRVFNAGRVPGYVTEITDIIAPTMEFIQAANPLWESVGGNRVVTRQLENRLLNPGEHADITITLRWRNADANMGMIQNLALITEYNNEPGLPDISSDNDSDDAWIILTPPEGGAQVIIPVTGTVLAILGTGIFLIRRYVLL